MQFKENLKQYRLALSLTQKDMAKKLNISERGYRNYEMGTREPDLTMLIQIADILHISLDKLVGRNFSE